MTGPSCCRSRVRSSFPCDGALLCSGGCAALFVVLACSAMAALDGFLVLCALIR